MDGDAGDGAIVGDDFGCISNNLGVIVEVGSEDVVRAVPEVLFYFIAIKEPE